MLRRLTLFLFPCLLLSNLAFSHLRESRNYKPLVVPMALMTAEYLLQLVPARQPPSNTY